MPIGQNFFLMADKQLFLSVRNLPPQSQAHCSQDVSAISKNVKDIGYCSQSWELVDGELPTGVQGERQLLMDDGESSFISEISGGWRGIESPPPSWGSDSSATIKSMNSKYNIINVNEPPRNASDQTKTWAKSSSSISVTFPCSKNILSTPPTPLPYPSFLYPSLVPLRTPLNHTARTRALSKQHFSR